MDERFLRDLARKEENFILGVKIERDTAEINFSNKESSQRALKILDNLKLYGKNLKVSVIEEVNKNLKKNI